MQLLSVLVQRLKGLKFDVIKVDGKKYIVADSITLVIRGEKGRSTVRFYANGKMIEETYIDWSGHVYQNEDLFHLSLPHIKTLLELQ